MPVDFRDCVLAIGKGLETHTLAEIGMAAARNTNVAFLEREGLYETADQIVKEAHGKVDLAGVVKRGNRTICPTSLA